MNFHFFTAPFFAPVQYSTQVDRLGCSRYDRRSIRGEDCLSLSVRAPLARLREYGFAMLSTP